MISPGSLRRILPGGTKNVPGPLQEKFTLKKRPRYDQSVLHVTSKMKGILLEKKDIGLNVWRYLSPGTLMSGSPRPGTMIWMYAPLRGSGSP